MLASTCALNFPLKLPGTRHEYLHIEPQPYSNLPLARILAFSSTILNCGSGSRFPFFTAPPIYFSPACPSTVMPIENWLLLIFRVLVLTKRGGPGFLLLLLIRESGWPLISSRVHLSPISSVTDSVDRAAFCSVEDEERSESQNKPTITTRAAVAMPIKMILPLREDKSLIKLDIMADVICFILVRFYLKKGRLIVSYPTAVVSCSLEAIITILLKKVVIFLFLCLDGSIINCNEVFCRGFHS